jgi:N-acetylneuraminic acid mutarotase
MVSWSKTLGLTIITSFLIGMASSAMSVLTLGQGQVENTWTTVSPLPKAHLSPALGTALDGQIYLIGYDIAERYDPVSDNWTAIAPMPQETGGPVVACQDKIYVIGRIIQVYDPITNSWANKTSIPPSLSGIRAAVVGDKIYFISGGTAGYIIEDFNTTYVYDPAADSWSTMAPIPTPVQSYACAVLNNKIYIIGGAQVPKFQDLKASDLVQIFDPEANQWSAGSPLIFGVTRAEGCATLGINASERIYVMGGYSSTYLVGTLSKVPNPSLLNQVYNPETGSWTLEAALPDIQWGFSLVNVNDVFYAVGGYDKGSITLNNGQTTSGQTTQRYIPLGYTSNAYPSSTSTVPEFSWLTILPILLAIPIALAIDRKRLQRNV